MANKVKGEQLSSVAGPLTSSELNDFVSGAADFAFEMSVLRELRAVGFECSHSGTYVDPVTNKIRQFDIRAVRGVGERRLAMAVECKNLRTAAPVMVMASPRTAAEAVLDVVRVTTGLFIIERTRADEFGLGIYDRGDMVGRKVEQVQRSSSGALTSLGDEEVFVKQTQAINSGHELIRRALFEDRSRAQVHTVIPVVVVPGGTLWQVDYSDDGQVLTPPRPVTRSSLYVGHSWSYEIMGYGEAVRYQLSHLELVTPEALGEVPGRYFGTTQRIGP